MPSPRINPAPHWTRLTPIKTTAPDSIRGWVRNRFDIHPRHAVPMNPLPSIPQTTAARHRRQSALALCLPVTLILACMVSGGEPPARWPEIDATCKPWTYNWWMASAVDRENLTRQLTRFRDAGLGGIHIVPIYGVKGAEDRSIEYLSPEWMQMLAFTVGEARRLGLGVDMTTGSGWCFGGPQVTQDMAGQSIRIGNDGVQIRPSGRKVKRAAPGGEGFMINPLHGEAMDRYLARFSAAFAGLPANARPRAMYHDSYEYNGAQWSPDLLEEFAKRRGYRLEHHWLAFAGEGDEETAARVRSDYRETVSDMMVENVFPRWVSWCRERGMLTRNQAHGSPANLLDLYALADIPETELFGRGQRDPLRSGFDARFGEGDRDPLIPKFASSAAHLAGRRLVAAETLTWMAEHFCGTLEEAKCFADLLFVSGVNHIIYHGSCYSPDDAEWPGWLFYASTQMNPRNAIWHDLPTLNTYIARCQAVLRSGTPDNDILLYWPLHDRWHDIQGGLPEMLTVHHREWLTDEAVGRVARELWHRGVGFDYLSDRLLEKVTPAPDGGIAAGESRYRAIVVPAATRVPVPTMAKLLALARRGARVMFVEHLPSDVPGLGDLDARRRALANLLAEKHRFAVGPLDRLLDDARISGEGVCRHRGALMIRRRVPDGHWLFVANQGSTLMDGWFPLATPARSVAVMDPMTGDTGAGEIRIPKADGRVEVRLRIEPGNSLILRCFDQEQILGEPWRFDAPGTPLAELAGPWQVTFQQGGPVLPRPYTANQLTSWTNNGDPETLRFAGSAVYRKDFAVDDAALTANARFVIDLGSVKHSARVTLNGRALGTLIMAPYRLTVPPGLLKPSANVLEVEVTNLSANRIRDLDRRKMPWRIFHDANVVNIGYKPFDASRWPVFDSGLLGPVRLRRAE